MSSMPAVQHQLSACLPGEKACRCGLEPEGHEAVDGYPLQRFAGTGTVEVAGKYCPALCARRLIQRALHFPAPFRRPLKQCHPTFTDSRSTSQRHHGSVTARPMRLIRKPCPCVFISFSGRWRRSRPAHRSVASWNRRPGFGREQY